MLYKTRQALSKAYWHGLIVFYLLWWLMFDSVNIRAEDRIKDASARRAS